jgi:DNA polymerase III sliding clamp (beta) subunit (PCNA family)
MKIYFSDPRRQLAALKPLLGSRANIQAVRHFLFEADPEGLYVTSTDLEVGLRIYHPAQVVIPGKAIVPVSVVDLLEGEDVMTLHLTEKALSVQCGGFSRACPILDPGEFPISPGIESGNPVEIHTGALEQLLGIVRFLSNDDSRVIDALQITWTPGRVTATGTDGFKLARSTVQGECQAPGSTLLTRRSAAALGVLAQRAGDEPLTLSASGEKFTAHAGRDRLWASQRVGNYPEVSELLKAAQAARITGQVEFRAFQKSVERSLKALLDEKDRKGANATLTAGDGQLTIAFEAPEVGSGEAHLPFANDGAEPLSATFNLDILENVLSGLRSVHKGLETCQLSLSGPASPMVLGAPAEHGPVLALVMPVVEA